MSWTSLKKLAGAALELLLAVNGVVKAVIDADATARHDPGIQSIDDQVEDLTDGLERIVDALDEDAGLIMLGGRDPEQVTVDAERLVDEAAVLLARCLRQPALRRPILELLLSPEETAGHAAAASATR